MQAANTAELVGPRLDVLGRHDHAMLLRGAHRQLVPHELFDETVELTVQLQQPHELAGIDHLVIDLHYRRHLNRSLKVEHARTSAVKTACLLIYLSVYPATFLNGSSPRSISRRSRTTISAVAVMP